MKFLLFLALTLSFNLFAVGSKRNSAEPLSDNPYYGGYDLLRIRKPFARVESLGEKSHELVF